MYSNAFQELPPLHPKLVVSQSIFFCGDNGVLNDGSLLLNKPSATPTAAKD